MKKILIVEDEKEVLDNLSDLMELEGFFAIQSVNGLEGIRKAKTELPDLIICDISMPIADGYEVLRELKSCKQTNSIPFIMLTARSAKEDIDKAMQLGADNYITKPFINKQLIDLINLRINEKSKRDKSEKYFRL
jgi:CheY-like chemotaxis protein